MKPLGLKEIRILRAKLEIINKAQAQLAKGRMRQAADELAEELDLPMPVNLGQLVSLGYKFNSILNRWMLDGNSSTRP